MSDSRYSGTSSCTQRSVKDDQSYLHSVARATHETLNARLKSFDILCARFLHGEELHVYSFHVVIRLIELVQCTGECSIFINTEIYK